MVGAKREECFQEVDGIHCYVDGDGFWYTDKGIIIKWILLVTFFAIFFGWFVGGYIHAKRRLRRGLPLLPYHRFLVSYSERRRYGQAAPPQNHFTFYQTQNPYQQQQSNPTAYQQRQDGAWAEPPPLYHNTDAPPQYFAPPGATKADPSQGGGAGGVELGQYGPAGPAGLQGGQQSGFIGAGEGTSGSGHGEQTESSTPGLPPRPESAKTRLKGMVGRFRR